MAEEELELDVNQAKKKSPLLLIIIVIVLLNVGGIAAWILLGSSSGDGDNESSEEGEIVLGPLKYQTMVPEFVVNFGPGSKVRYLQVDLQLSTRDESALKIVSTYRPVIRNDVLVVLSGVKFDDLKNRSGKEALRKKLLDTINKVVSTAGKPKPEAESESESAVEDKDTKVTDEVVTDETVKGPIENVYFTSFIMQ